MIEYAVACLPLIFFFIYISRNDTELTHRNTFLIKERERYSAIIMQSSKFFIYNKNIFFFNSIVMNNYNFNCKIKSKMFMVFVYYN